MASLKTLARLACPDCMMDRCDFWKMGMKKDMADRLKHTRKDSTILHRAITMVCEWVFKGTSPESESIKKTRIGQLCMTVTRV